MPWRLCTSALTTYAPPKHKSSHYRFIPLAKLLNRSLRPSMPPVSPADGPVVVTGCVSHTQILHTYARHIAPGWNRRAMVSGTVVRQHGTNSIYSVFYRRVTHLLAVAHSIPVGGLQQQCIMRLRLTSTVLQLLSWLSSGRLHWLAHLPEAGPCGLPCACLCAQRFGSRQGCSLAPDEQSGGRRLARAVRGGLDRGWQLYVRAPITYLLLIR